MKLIPKSQSAPYPPGNGYSYKEPKTGRWFDGLLGNVTVTAQKVIAFKLANPHIFPEGGGDLESTIQLIYAQKFETHPHLFMGQEPAPQPQPTKKTQAVTVHPRYQLTKLCRFCGSAEFDEILCPTCSGKRVTGYKCRKCGKKQ